MNLIMLIMFRTNSLQMAGKESQLLKEGSSVSGGMFGPLVTHRVIVAMTTSTAAVQLVASHFNC